MLFRSITLNIGIGNQYKATHSLSLLNRALNIAGDNPKLRACAYGMGSHLIIDSYSHNQLVPGAIKQTSLVNGLIHSPKEIYDKNLFVTIEDRRYSREVLDIADDEEIVEFFEKVFVDDPALSKISIPLMIDFFRTQVQSDNSGGYSLGFRSFFALPKFVYIFLFIGFLFSISLFGLTIRKVRDGIRDTPTIFIAIFGFVSLVFFGTAIYGLFSANLWSIWESLSQYLFSPYMYGIALLFLLFGGYLIYAFIMKPRKLDNLGNLSVALFLLMLGGYMVTLPMGLHTGNEEVVYKLQIQEVSKMLTQGAGYVLTFQDPVGAKSLSDANESGALARTIYLWTLFGLFISIIYFAFRGSFKRIINFIFRRR